MKYPFNKERAMRGEPVVTRDGKAAEHQGKWNQPLVFISDGKGPFVVEDDGKYCGVLEDHPCDLFMLTPDHAPSAPIPFDWDKYNSGEWDVKYRNGENVKALYYIPEAAIQDIITIQNSGEVMWHYLTGEYLRSKTQHSYDLLLTPKQVTRWFNVYRDIDGTLKTGIECSSEEMAKIAMRGNDRHVGTYSFTTNAKP